MKIPNLPFRDRVWRISFDDGRDPAFVAEYNDEITGWSDNVPEELKDYGGHLHGRMRCLSVSGMAFFDIGPNE